MSLAYHGIINNLCLQNNIKDKEDSIDERTYQVFLPLMQSGLTHFGHADKCGVDMV